MIFRPFFDADTSTYTYLIGDPKTRKAVLIDPVLEQVDRDLQFVKELGLELSHVFETHVHADHVTGAGLLRERTGCIVVGGKGGASCADRHVEHDEVIEVGDLRFRALATPGHTHDSFSFYIDGMVFTGDTLFVRGTGRTDFQNGDPEALYDSITRVLFALPDETLVYPGHDYAGRMVTTIGEEKRHNPRLAGKSKEEFVHIMNNLNLPRPKKIDVAVPANRACGDLGAVSA